MLDDLVRLEHCRQIGATTESPTIRAFRRCIGEIHRPWISPKSLALATAWIRFPTASFPKMLFRCHLVVFGEI